MNKFSQSGVPVKEMIDILQKCRSLPDDQKKRHLENLGSRVSSPEISMKMNEIINSTDTPNSLSNGAQIKNPQFDDPNIQSSGNFSMNTNKLIQDLIDELRSGERVSEVSFNFEKYSQSKAPPANKDDKKKSRGNPFRVLMGKVGKMLDHGLERRDIVRFLVKEKIWNEETIEKSIKIVKEYNKKKHLKSKGNKKEAQTLLQDAPEWPRVDAKDYSQKSTPELITSILWLNSLMKVTPQRADVKEVEDRSGVKTMIRNIRSELTKRGMGEADLNALLK
jgi:hypothetical protein